MKFCVRASNPPATSIQNGQALGYRIENLLDETPLISQPNAGRGAPIPLKQRTLFVKLGRKL